jgi:hypothetical protein
MIEADGVRSMNFVDPNNPYWFDASGSSFTPRYGMIDVSLSQNIRRQLRWRPRLVHPRREALRRRVAPGASLAFSP